MTHSSHSTIKGYAYLAIGAFLLLIALPTILKIMLFFVALFFILYGLSTLQILWKQ